MTLSRRAFVRTLTPTGTGSAPGWLVAARGREALEAESWPHGIDAAAAPETFLKGGAPPPPGLKGGASPPPGLKGGAPPPPDPAAIYINSNENPLGPGPAAVAAIEAAFVDAGRYPMNARPAMADLRALVATSFGVKTDGVALGAGSGELLRAAVRAFTSRERHFVTAAPSFEAPERTAAQIGVPVKAIPVDAAGRLDLEAMAAASRGAGLVFVCNPNNPTATVHGAAAIRDFVGRVRRDSPDTAILLDEAYHDYVIDPAYATGAPLALEHPRVFITRTFSKAYGMAGLRVGYAVGQADTIKAIARYLMPYNINVPAIAAAHVAFQDAAHIERERTRNTEVRKITLDFFKTAGLRATESQANFIFVDLSQGRGPTPPWRRPVAEFRDACRKQGVHIGRDFPPLDKTHVRISCGTMDEMRRATQVFAKLLGATATSSAR